MNRLYAALLIGVLASTVSCAQTFSHSQPSYVPHDAGRPLQVYPRLKGESCQWRLLGLWGIGGDNSLSAAIGKMTRGSKKIDNVFAVNVEKKVGYFFLLSRHCTVASGYPVVYKDTLPKQELFEDNMMHGKLVKKPAVSGGGGTVSTPRVTHTGGTSSGSYGGTKSGGTYKAPTTSRSSAPTKKQCDGKCTKFSKLWKGSDAIRSTIRGQCVKKCLKPDNHGYRTFIDNASKIDDIAKCNGM